ncbi:MAG: hypothetical protein M1281_09300 [Chloroflexi bacterium]|nr:hypothetical protein [Chloroflexota bacterium]
MMVVRKDTDPPAKRSHLFMLRLWLEDLGSGQKDWRGKVQHVSSGEARFFRDWKTLEAFIEERLLKIDSEGNHGDQIEIAIQEPR